MGQRSSLMLALRQSFFLPAPPFTEKELEDLTGKVTIITGGYTGIGLSLAHLLYASNSTLYLAGRSHEKANRAIQQLKDAHPNSKGSVCFLYLDLADLATIKPAVQEFLSNEERLDVLVNNAGIMWAPQGSTSAQGFEMHIATNVYGPFLLTLLLKPMLASTAKKSAEGSVRVTWAGSIGVEIAAPVGSVLFESSSEGERLKEGLNKNELYGQSKCANVMLGCEAARRWSVDGIVSVSWNPGNLQTELTRHGGWFEKMAAKLIVYPPIFGAYTELFAGWSPEITPEKNGCYVHPWGRVGAYNKGLERAIMQKEDGGGGKAEKLWDVCWEICRAYM